MQNLKKSFQFALCGIAHTLQTQRNMKIHFLCALLVLIFGMLIPFDFITRVILFFCIAQVFVAELVNTAIEATVDILTRVHHPLAKIAKDTAAGAVFICAFTSAFIFAIILYADFHTILHASITLQSSLWFFVPLMICETVGLFFNFSKKIRFLKYLCSSILLFFLFDQTVDLFFFILTFILINLSGYASFSRSQNFQVFGNHT